MAFGSGTEFHWFLGSLVNGVAAGLFHMIGSEVLGGFATDFLGRFILWWFQGFGGYIALSMAGYT